MLYPSGVVCVDNCQQYIIPGEDLYTKNLELALQVLRIFYRYRGYKRYEERVF
jgi:hypothetical protein